MEYYKKEAVKVCLGVKSTEILPTGKNGCKNAGTLYRLVLDDEPSVFQEVLKTKGEMAVHHVYPDIRPLNAAEYDAIHSRYLGLGYEAALEMVLPGLGRCTLFDAREELGVFVELLEISPAVYASLENMHTAHVNWDGSRPIREFMESMPH